MPPVTLGVSLKMYFGHRQAVQWFERVAALARTSFAVSHGDVELFVMPTFVQIPAALAAFAGTPVRVGAQDVATADAGAYTGEVSAAELAEMGVTLAEVGHAERRGLFGEDTGVVAAKTAAAARHNLTPVLCVGETERMDPAAAADAVIAQAEADLADAAEGPVIIAYEPVWAIGAAEPAPHDHIRTVVTRLRAAVGAGRPGTRVLYGGSAGPGLLTALGADVDGLFLGRFAHDPAALAAVIDEAAAMAEQGVRA